MRAAEGRDSGQSSALGDHLADSDPLVGARHIVGVLACREELAEDLLEHEEVFDIAAGDGRERFVEQHHALFVAVAVHEAGTEIGQRHKLQICVALNSSDSQRLPKAHLLRRPVTLEHAEVQRNPPALGRIRRVTQERFCARQPTAAYCPVTNDCKIHVREGASDAHHPDVIAGVPMRGVGPLPGPNCQGKVHLEIRHPRQPLDHVTSS